MKTYQNKINQIKPSVLLVTITAFIVSFLLFTSCSESDGINGLQDDSSLIEKIETATKTIVSASSLPASTEVSLNGDLLDSSIETVELASGFGYKVSLVTDNAEREETKSDVFFSLQGRQLDDTDEKRGKRRKKCFEFVFPIDFIMPDDTTITLNSKEDWVLIRTWYQDNPNTTERAELVFPVNIILKEDGSTQTLLDKEELLEVKQNCRKGKDKRKCFKLVLPVSFTMPDASVITVNEKEDFSLVRAWYTENPNITEKPALNFPVDIEYRDGTTATIADETEFEAAKTSCRD